ncbi:hypothetical protein HPE56_16200 [Maribacter sp. ANRC-HE7]|uniref:GLPGLI family protein n=1 Tax=Maribacter aquimaris TaxID=2737171 RepID=A0ABR7V6Q9_9FLAO|nr:DUF6503 family protein [Maribacter aquimaris]MBD0779341.1 hypothetical protein [Maribacter aquimaris]
MKRFLLTMIVMVGLQTVTGQDLTSTQLLDKAIAYHDPNQLWNLFAGKLFITLQYADGKERQSEIEINLPKEYFKITTFREDDIVLELMVEKNDCSLKLNGETTISDEDKKTYRLSCEQALKTKDYYTYLYGLPMKLKDPGTIIDPKVETKTFRGKEYLVLKVNYEEGIGKDTWYFYFDPTTYAMEVYQFYHDESKNDGEYILLSDVENVASIKIPKTRAWYTNSDDRLLGIDILTKAEPLK